MSTLPTLAEFVEDLAARGIRPTVVNNRLRFPGRTFQSLTDDEHTFIRHHRDDIKALISRGGLPDPVSPPAAPEPVVLRPEPPVEPEPEIVVGGRRITEADVCRVMRSEGDEMLAAYLAGRISKPLAYSRTAATMRARLAFATVQPQPFLVTRTLREQSSSRSSAVPLVPSTRPVRRPRRRGRLCG